MQQGFISELVIGVPIVEIMAIGSLSTEPFATMADAYDYEATLKELEAENPQTITWNGTAYACIYGDTVLQKGLGFGGYVPESDLTVVIRNSVFSENLMPEDTIVYPNLKEDIFVEGKNFHLDKITKDPTNTFRVWALTDPAKGSQ